MDHRKTIDKTSVKPFTIEAKSVATSPRIHPEELCKLFAEIAINTQNYLPKGIKMYENITIFVTQEDNGKL